MFVKCLDNGVRLEVTKRELKQIILGLHAVQTDRLAKKMLDQIREETGEGNAIRD